jgi:hypothetical protein
MRRFVDLLLLVKSHASGTWRRPSMALRELQRKSKSQWYVLNGLRFRKNGPVIFKSWLGFIFGFSFLRELLELPFVSPLQNVQYTLYIQFLGNFFAFPLGEMLLTNRFRYITYRRIELIHSTSGNEIGILACIYSLFYKCISWLV